MGERSGRRCCRVTVGPEFRAYVNDAVGRFAYLYPSVEIEIGEGLILVTDADIDLAELARDFHFTLCRQKIYAETLPLRRALIEGVMRR